MALFTNVMVTELNSTQNRISLIRMTATGNGLTTLSYFHSSCDGDTGQFKGGNGFPVMQPLCGTIGKEADIVTSCP